MDVWVYTVVPLKPELSSILQMINKFLHLLVKGINKYDARAPTFYEVLYYKSAPQSK